MAIFKPNQAGINFVKHGHGGPVYRHIEAAQRATVINAKAKAPRDTGVLQASIHAEQPDIVPGGLMGRVRARAISRNGIDYAYIVHQGRGPIRPVRAPELKFFWKKHQRLVRTQYVGPRAGRPYLAEALRVVSSVLGFRYQPGKPHRTDES